MNLQAFSLTKHSLAGHALKKWWQCGDPFFKSFRRQLQTDKFRNSALRSNIVFLATAPFGFCLNTYIIFSKGPVDSVDLNLLEIFLSVVILSYCAICTHFWFTLKTHRNRVLKVQVTESGLILESLFLNRSVPWSQIRDSYFDQNQDCIVETVEKDVFILSNELTESDQLFHLINMRKPVTARVFTNNYHLPNEVIDTSTLACLAIVAACMVSLVKPIDYLAQHVDLVATLLALMLLSAAISRICLTKVVRSIRINDFSCLLQIDGSTKDLMRDQIKDVKRFGPIVVLKSNSDWFIVLADKDCAVTSALLECQNNKRRIGP